jgi:hypothetical protein
MNQRVEELVRRLDSSDAAERRSSLEELAHLAEKGQSDLAPRNGWINLHAHTFFSYNGYGYSPSHFAWEAFRRGLEAAGIVDFDCLDGTREFLDAGRILRLKTTAGFETRVFIEEYRDKVINSPKEPGVFYLVGTGFVEPPEPGTAGAKTLADMGARARDRNLAMLSKLNDHLTPLHVDYEEDVLPLTAAGNATERHMVTAIESRARDRFGGGGELVEFWADKLDVDREEIQDLIDDPVPLKGLIRSHLMKHGGVGYAQPDRESFPPLEEVVQMTRQQGALPSACWLDGTSEGESDPLAHFGFLRDKGCVSITIIPDRNWNVPEEERDTKVMKLNEAIEAACELDLPILVGTEMNKRGTKLVDDFASDALAPHLETFRRGAHVLWGHTLLKMTAGVGYVGEWAETHFDGSAAEKNSFFREIGEKDYPGERAMKRLRQIGPTGAPEDFQQALLA